LVKNFFFKFLSIKIFLLDKLVNYLIFIRVFIDHRYYLTFFTINELQFYNICSLITIMLIFIFLLSITIWTRASGPRTRVDQLHYLTWKEILISLFIIIILLIITFIAI